MTVSRSRVEKMTAEHLRLVHQGTGKAPTAQTRERIRKMHEQIAAKADRRRS